MISIKVIKYKYRVETLFTAKTYFCLIHENFLLLHCCLFQFIAYSVEYIYAVNYL